MTDKYIDENGFLDIEGLYAGAAEAEEKRQEAARKVSAERRAAYEAEQKKEADFMRKVSESVKAEREAKAAAEIAAETAKSAAEIAQRIGAKHNTATDPLDKAYRQLLNSDQNAIDKATEREARIQSLIDDFRKPNE